MTTNAASSSPESPQRLSVGFVLMPKFTLLPFSAFLDALRLAADEEDHSEQIQCQWTIMNPTLEPIASSSGVMVTPWETLQPPNRFNYIVVVGGLLPQTLNGSNKIIQYLKTADQQHVPIIGLCTGSFAMIRAGLMHGRRCCVSWFHRRDLIELTNEVIPVSEQLFVDDGDRITCAGGAVAADLAAYIIERHLGQSWARKSLRILVMDAPRPATSLQPAPTGAVTVSHPLIKRALLLLEQNLTRPLSNQSLASRLNISKRQLERLFLSEMGSSLQRFYRDMRLNYGAWLLQNTHRSITDIAQEIGFSDTAHFSRACKSVLKRTPSQIRNTKS